jgi:hypothetical protein
MHCANYILSVYLPCYIAATEKEYTVAPGLFSNFVIMMYNNAD